MSGKAIITGAMNKEQLQIAYDYIQEFVQSRKEKLLLPTSILGVGKASPRIADVPTAGLILCADIPPASALGTVNLFATMFPA